MAKSDATRAEPRHLILALDTSTPACTAALFAADGTLFARADQIIGRGHAEYLAPMIADMLSGHTPSIIWVGVGPGSFTGLRIGIACAQGLGIGWEIPVHGMDSLALIAAGAPGDGPIAVAVTGGHGELFVAQYDRPGLTPMGAVANLTPIAAAAVTDASLAVGSGAGALVEARGSGESIDRLPSAADALKLPIALRSLSPSPLYARAPDARPLNSLPAAA
ncbi:MAG: tRNA (adenosine(37)-N6)-threonylcarbamoyltransferase complex dimerization subunit type 1 TsaB [Sphingomicrobium sp.]